MTAALGERTRRDGASFELERLDLDDGQLVVSGWWHGVRGMRFVRPALIIDGRQRLATLEHKPWAAEPDGVWTAAFPWQDDAPPKAGDVTLVVAPSVQVPLDGGAPAPIAAVVVPDRGPAAPERPADGSARPVLDEQRLLLAKLRDAEEAVIAGERRFRELEQIVARDREAVDHARVGRDKAVRSEAAAIADRDRAVAQHAEAVDDREAAMRWRTRMERERDEAFAERDEAVAQREETSRRRDELLLAHQTLQRRLRGEWARRDRDEPDADPAAADTTTAPVAVAPADDDRDRPSGVRIIPAARTVAATLHRAQREPSRGLTHFDLWAARVLGTAAAIAFILLLVMILRAFFVF